MADDRPTLFESFTHTPVKLAFGTSGRRGKIVDLTQNEVYLNARAELEYLQGLSRDSGGIRQGEEFFYAYDLRPSSIHYEPEYDGRGEIAQAIERAIRDAAMEPVNLGPIPTPALASFALARDRGSIMVTGSHIPFDRNGFKTFSSIGELLKSDEGPINTCAEWWRAHLYDAPYSKSIFNERGNFKSGSSPCMKINNAAQQEYVQRYLDFFGGGSLNGARVFVYQHSAVGRDLLVETLEQLGAVTIPVGRSETFTPIDTEAIDAHTLETVARLVNENASATDDFHAIVSTDGDSDRPLFIGLERNAKGKYQAQFYGGDLIGMIVAEFFRADAIVVPISCNDGIERGPLKSALRTKTRIGSPYVIEGMRSALMSGALRVCGWEANGGFLTCGALSLGERELPALPTRDAFLPLITILQILAKEGLTATQLFGRLPRRFSKAGLLREIPRSQSMRLMEYLVGVLGDAREPPTSQFSELITRYFTALQGFPSLRHVDITDGVRLNFSNGDVAHLRPSGNADELRIYAVADTQERADEIVDYALSTPSGILARMISLVT